MWRGLGDEIPSVSVGHGKRSGNGECKAHPKAEDGRRREAQNRERASGMWMLLFGSFSCSPTSTN